MPPRFRSLSVARQYLELRGYAVVNSATKDYDLIAQKGDEVKAIAVRSCRCSGS